MKILEMLKIKAMQVSAKGFTGVKNSKRERPSFHFYFSEFHGAGSKASYRRRKRGHNRRTLDASEDAEMVDLEASGSGKVLYTLDASRWPVKGALLQTSAMGA